MTQLSRFESLPEQVQDDLHLVMYWSEHYGTQAEANAAERLTDYFAQAAESAELDRLRQQVAELEALIAYIDAHSPRADATCVKPGITLSEAARLQMAEEKERRP